MRTGGLPGVSRLIAARRVLAPAVVAGMATAALGVFPGAASASVAPHRPLRPGVHTVSGAGMSLAQTPAGLRAAVRKTLGSPTAGAGNVSQQAELTAADGTSADDFGNSVAISGSTAVVGAPYRNSDTGAAYVFVRSGTVWSQQAELTAGGSAHVYFGISVAISGSTVVVGALGSNSGTGAAAHVFVRSGTVWSQQAKLTDPSGGRVTDFGSSVAISGSTALVGAYATNSVRGAVYVFVRSGAIWSQQAKLTETHGAVDDALGFSVAISGSTAVVGAYDYNFGVGAVYVFVRAGTVWSQQAKLTAPGSVVGGVFGFSVAVSKSTAVVGAPAIFSDSAPGAAYVFVRSGTAWSQQAELTAPESAAGNHFGFSAAIAGSTAVVGAPYTGAADVFVRSGTAWSWQSEVFDPDGSPYDYFGTSVAMSGSTGVVCATDSSLGKGAAYVFVNV